MMWVVRAGQDAVFLQKYIDNNKVYIPWEGYKIDLSKIESREEYRSIVEKEKGTTARTSVSNWAGQLYTFVKEMNIDDYVLIPTLGSRKYYLAKITCDYCFDKDDTDGLYHSRNIKILYSDIPRDAFEQSVIYSLGAYRTIFKAKHEDEILSVIAKLKEGKR